MKPLSTAGTSGVSNPGADGGRPVAVQHSRGLRRLATSGLSEEQLIPGLREDLGSRAYSISGLGCLARRPIRSSSTTIAHTADFSTAAGARPSREVREQIPCRLSALQRASLVSGLGSTSLKRRTEIEICMSAASDPGFVPPTKSRMISLHHGAADANLVDSSCPTAARP